MTKNGTVKRWDMTKGFGFIHSPDVPADVFFHIKAFKSNAGALPHEGMTVRFEEIHVGGKGPRATFVQPLVDKKVEHTPHLQPKATQTKTTKSLTLTPTNSHSPQQRLKQTAIHKNPTRTANTEMPVSRWLAFVSLLIVWAGLLVFGLTSQRLSVWVLPALAILNVTTLFAYAFDKNAAERGWWRTAEKTLHLFAFAGGWPAAWLAQQVLRHKNIKQSFQSAYWTSAMLHCLLLGVWVFWLHANLELPLK